MPDSEEIVLVTEVPTFEIVDDRLQCTITSGKRQRTYSITKHKARAGIQSAMWLLDQHDRTDSNVREFKKRK